MTTLLAIAPSAEAGKLKFFAPADSDGDGVPDRRDACVVLAETPNGYADDDGCPDHLAALDVLPHIGDTLVSAEVTLTRKGRTTSTTGEPRVAEDLIPGERVVIEARALCYAARGEIVVEQGRNHVDLELTPHYDQRLTWSLTDADGSPLTDATLQFDSPCASSQRLTLADGRGTVRVGQGEHRVRIEAPGYEPQEHIVRADAGSIDIALVPVVDRTDALAGLQSIETDEAPES